MGAQHRFKRGSNCQRLGVVIEFVGEIVRGEIVDGAEIYAKQVADGTHMYS
jgi:hypothetical protein